MDPEGGGAAGGPDPPPLKKSQKYRVPFRTVADPLKNHKAIIALKASGRDCTNNNELLHKIGVL